MTSLQKESKLIVDVVKHISIKLDEMWSYVKNKSKQRWLWYEIYYKTGQMYDIAIGLFINISEFGLVV